MSTPQETQPRKPQRAQVRSFVRRAGRIGPGQQKALEALSPLYVTPFQGHAVDWAQTFGRLAPLVVEIGFGMGDATAIIAAARPDIDFIGIEVHEPGVGALLKRIQGGGLENLRIVKHDAVEVLTHMVMPMSLAGIHIFFPDPWHKKRHNKRRLIQPDFVSMLVSRLQRGGYLHCATDWEPYAQQMLEVLSSNAELRNEAKDHFGRPDWRPPTKFELRGLRLGHTTWDLHFCRQAT